MNYSQTPDTRVSELLALRRRMSKDVLSKLHSAYETQEKEGLKSRLRPILTRLAPDLFRDIQGIVTRDYQASALKLLASGLYSTCAVCGTKIFKDRESCWNPGCYTSLSDKDKARRARAETNLSRYGVAHPGQVEEGKVARVKTCVEKYGVENPSQSDSVKKKKERTYLQNYGARHFFASDSGKESVKSSLINSHGVDNPGKLDFVKELNRKRFSLSETQEALLKRRTELLESGELDGKAIQAARTATTRKRYGVDNISQLEETKLRKVASSLINFGTRFPSQSKEVKRKIRETNLARYGFAVSSQNPEVQKKIRDTYRKRYGVDHIFSSEEFQARIRATNRLLYGFDYPNQNPEQFLKNQKTAFKRVDFITKEGKVLILQGQAEPLAARYLESNGCVLYPGPTARIEYIGENGKPHFYHPDFKIKKGSKYALVEVKSVYTLSVELGRNLRKFTAATEYCTQLGISFVLVVPTPGGMRVFKNPSQKPLLQFLNSEGFYPKVRDANEHPKAKTSRLHSAVS